MTRPDAAFVVRNLRADEWDLHRRVRLAALRADPEAFGATLASSEELTVADWRRRTDDRAWFALADGEAIGMVRLWFDPDTRPTPEIIALWVDPAHRGEGVGRQLMLAALSAATEVAGAAELWVVDSNLAARALYDSLGFRPTGGTETLPDGRREIQMAWNG